MREHEIELAAAGKGTPLKDMTISEECLYIGLRGTYTVYFSGQLSRKDATTRKKMIISKCRDIEQHYDRTLEAYKVYQENVRKAGQCLSEIEHETDIKELALKACKCISAMTGDESFYKRQLIKFEEVIR